MHQFTVDQTSELSDRERSQVTALVATAAAHDGAEPLSEQFRLDLRSGSGVNHVLAYAGSTLTGYAQLSDGAAELVVDPAVRRQGVGTALLAQVRRQVRVWAHGDVPAAAAFAAAHDLEVTRELFVLGLPLDGGPPLADPSLPDDLVVRAFEPGRDEDEWLRVNAAAFSHHPEQGDLTRDDLAQRMAEAWFDPAGFLLVVPREDPGSVAAFHWTKVHPAGEQGPARVGEVYVVGVDPAYQGRGLGRPLTLLGLHHLRREGLTDVILYVDGDNPAALTVYRGLGFTTRGVDRMYSRAVHPTVERWGP